MLPSEKTIALRGRWDYCVLVCFGACDKRGCEVFFTPPCLLFGENCARAHSQPFCLWSILFLFPCALFIAMTIGLAVSARSWSTTVVVFGSLWIAAFLVMVAMGTVNRSWIQSRFNIDAHHRCPALLIWTLFCPCALCQETRTLRLNNVDLGLWHGGMSTDVLEGKYRLFSLL